jgi:peptidoglycan/xylan/chitin deacetylase (PgdA/CDA1 family)
MRPFSLAVIMYHYVRDPRDTAESGSGIPGMTLSRFESQLDSLMANYEMIAWPELRDFLQGGPSLPDRACLLTFDDGVRDHYLNVFPALRTRGLSGLFFSLARHPGMGLTLGHQIHFLLARLGLHKLREAFFTQLDADHQKEFNQADAKYRQVEQPGSLEGEIDVFKLVLQRDLSDIAGPVLSRLIEKYIGSEVEIAADFFLNQDQMEEMAAGKMHFGGHSRSHPWFDWIDLPSQAQEIECSARWLSTLEKGPWAFAFPYGGWNAQSPALLRTKDFIAAFTTIPQVNHSDPLQIGRYNAETFTPELMAGNPFGGYA